MLGVVAALGALSLLGPTRPAAGASSSHSGSSSSRVGLGLLGQSTWVTPGQTFRLQFSVSGTASTSPADLELNAYVYGALLNRTALAGSESGHDLTDLLWSQDYPLDRMAVLPGGYSFCVPVDVEPKPACPAATPLLTGGVPGVYPVVLQLYNTMTLQVVANLYTHLVIVAAKPSADPLSFALVVPVTAPHPLSPQGGSHIGGAAVGRIDLLQADLADHGSVALTLAPDPSTISALADTASPTARNAVAGLRRLAPGVQILARPFAPVDPYQLVQTGLAPELSAQLTRGEAVDQADLGIRPPPATWLMTGPLDHATAANLAGLGVSDLVVPGEDLQPAFSALTTAEPFPLQAGKETLPALVEDGGLAGDLSISDPVLAVHDLLADLAQIYFESPNLLQVVNGADVPEPRGVVAVAPADWAPSPSADEALLDGLADSPIVRSATVADLFAELGPSAGSRQAAQPANRRPDLDARQVRAERQQLDSLTASILRPPPANLLIGDLILASEAAGGAASQREAYLGAARRRLEAEVHEVTVAASGITLTSRQAKVPISIISQLSSPIRVRVELTSSRLSFPGQGTRVSIEKMLTLRLRDTTWLVPVITRGTGRFDVTAKVDTADGRIELDAAKVTITSRAFSGVGIVLSVAALAMLAFWWGRALQKGRRNKRLVQRQGAESGAAAAS